MQQNNNQKRVRINGQIRVPEVRVVLDDGSSLGVIQTFEALKMAREQNLDLVEINPKASPPVARITNYGKLKYTEKKQQQEAKKNQPTQLLKEISFRPNTDINDLTHKLEQAKSFLQDGHKIKVICKFRGREITHQDIGREKMQWALDQLQGLIATNPNIIIEGKMMSMLIFPAKKS